MSDFGIDALERLVRSELAADGEAPDPETAADRWRALRRQAAPGGTPIARLGRLLEHKARRVLHEIRRRRSA